ncbi:sulfotransferase [Kiritimatiellaeota bacterium B1221]|nr:sulfotransferase [Kiritimatiellaeota bacterium B1221]
MSKEISNIFIIGLRRSGTTIFWETFRQDERFIAYDEPYNPHLIDLPEEHSKCVRKEFISLYNDDPELFRLMFSPITVEQESSKYLTSSQKKYLKWLLKGKRPVCIDFTRMNFKLEELYEIDPNAQVIHLIRDVREVAISHIIKRISRSAGFVTKLKSLIRTKLFWVLTCRCNGYGFQTIYKSLLKEGAVSKPYKESVRQISMVWKVATEAVEMDGRRLWGNKYSTVILSDFIDSPENIMTQLYEKFGLDCDELKYEKVKKLNKNPLLFHNKWNALIRDLEIVSYKTKI